MPEVRFVDTSILLEILNVPGKSQAHAAVHDELMRLAEAGVQLVLPIATIIETGNHIVQVADGNARRRCAAAFCALLEATAEGGLPWVLHSVAWDERMLRLLCEGPGQVGSFVELAAAAALGTGDLAIIAESELYATRTANVDVRVWTHDETLHAYAG